MYYSNYLRFPNFAGDETAIAAAETISGFDPLIGTTCSSELSFFLCSVYFPMCTEKVSHPIGPCRPLCLRVHKACSPLLKEFNYKWPSVLDCDKFPAENTPTHMCMGGPENSNSKSHDETEEELTTDSSENEDFQRPAIAADISTFHYASESGGMIALPGGYCSNRDWIYVNRTAQCVPQCSTNLDFSPLEITTARSTLVIGSMISVCVTTICLVAACIRGSPFTARRPIDRSLFFATLCFAISAAFYALSLLLREKIACIEYNEHLLYAVRGLPNTSCTFVATILYYFGTAGRLWWLMICIAWRWNMKEHSVAEMEKFIFRAHIISWALPLFLVTMALMAQSVYPEFISGVCLIGISSQSQHQIFNVLREFLIMVAAFLSIFSGCLTSRNPSSNQLSQISNTLPSAGIIGIFYPIAAAFILICSLQNHFNPLLGSWAPLAAFQLIADPALGTLIGVTYFVYILYACYQHGPISPGLLEKQGYLPAATTLSHQLPGTTTSCVTVTPASVYQQVSAHPSNAPGGSTYYTSSVIPGIMSSSTSPPTIPQAPIPPVPSL
uniref:Frizzled-4 n=1 Tax=Panagrolaimus superbus TaxID=310955 RepID=A0A914ZDE7_9BILA